MNLQSSKIPRELPEMVCIQLQDIAFIWARRLAFVLFIISCTVLLLNKGLQTETLLLLNKEKTSAVVIPIVNPSPQKVYQQSYKFYLRDNEVYYGSFRTRYPNLNLDQPIVVAYNPNFPSRNKKEGTYLLEFIAIVLLSLICLGLWYSTKFDFFINQNNKLLIAKYGTFTQGVIQARIRDKRSNTLKYRYYIVFQTENNDVIKRHFVSTKRFSAGEEVLVLFLQKKTVRFIVVDDLPVLAQKFFKKDAGLSEFTLFV